MHIDESSVNNVSEWVRYDDGGIVVPSYYWKTFLENNFTELTGISTYQHFRMTKDHKGTVFGRTNVESEEVPINILKKNIVIDIEKMPQWCYQVASLMHESNIFMRK